jgi:hypothetical protein
MPLLLPVPDFLKKIFHSSKQRQGIVYLNYQLEIHGTMWYFNSPELAKVLGITLDGAYKMMRTFAKIGGYVENWGIEYLPVPLRLSAHGLTYKKVREWIVIPERINALFYNKSKVESMTTKSTLKGEYNTVRNIPPTFYRLPPEEKVLQVGKWSVSKNWGMVDAFYAYLGRVKAEYEKVYKEWQTGEIAQYESIIPDHELDLLKNQFRHRTTTPTRSGRGVRPMKTI